MIRLKERIFAMKKRWVIRGVLVLLVSVAAGCASYQRMTAATESQQGVARATGTVTYRVRMVLPPDALVRVDLVDVSRQGAPALTIGLQEIETRGRQVPIPFEIAYKTAAIDPTRTYAVQARILLRGRPLFSNTITYTVITNGVVSNIEVVVEQIPGGDRLPVSLKSDHLHAGIFSSFSPRHRLARIIQRKPDGEAGENRRQLWSAPLVRLVYGSRFGEGIVTVVLI